MTLWLARWIMKCIAVKWLVSRVAFLVDRDGVHSFPHPFFSWIVAVFCPWHTHLCLCPRRCRLNWAARFWVPMCSCRFFFLVSLTTLEDKPVCHIYQWIARPTHGSVCNHCERMMDGYTLDDLIFGSGECSLMEDEVVVCVRRADPTQQEWDDWPPRMTYRINSFLMANGSNPEPDLATLNSL